MKYLLHLFLLLTLSVQSFAFITEWNPSNIPSRSGEEQFLNHHPFVGLFGAGVESVGQTQADANLSAYLETCQSDAPTELLNNEELKARFRSLVYDGTTNLLCVADSTYNSTNTHAISVVLTPNGGSSSIDIISNGNCNNAPSDAQINALYAEWIHSLTANENYDFNLVNFNRHNYEENDIFINIPSTNNSYAQSLEVSFIQSIPGLPEDPTTFEHYGLNSLLNHVSATQNLSISFEKTGVNTDRHVISLENVSRYVQLFLSTANISVIRNQLNNIPTYAASDITFTQSVMQLDRAHQLLTFLFNRNDANCLSNASDCRSSSLSEATRTARARDSFFQFEAFRLADDSDKDLIDICEDLNAISEEEDYIAVSNAIKTIIDDEDTLAYTGHNGPDITVNVFGDSAVNELYEIPLLAEFALVAQFRQVQNQLTEARDEATTSEGNIRELVAERNDLQRRLDQSRSDLSATTTANTTLQQRLARAQANYSLLANAETSNTLLRFVNNNPIVNKISKIEVFYNGQVPVVSGYVTSALHGSQDILIFNAEGQKAFRVDYSPVNEIERSCSQFNLNSDSQEYVLVNTVDTDDSQLYSLAVYRVSDFNDDGLATRIQLLALDENGDERDDTPILSKVESTNCLFQ